MTKRYNLDIDRTLGGNDSSHSVSPSQKAIKEYVDMNAGGYRCAKTLVMPDSGTHVVRMSDIYDGTTYMDSCIEIDTASNATIVVDEMPLYRSLFIVNNTGKSGSVKVAFSMEGLDYEVLNCDSANVSSFRGLSVDVFPYGARAVEMFQIGNTMNVMAHDIHMESHVEDEPGPGPEPETPDYLYFKANTAGSAVSLVSSMSPAPSLEWSSDGETWTAWEATPVVDAESVDEEPGYWRFDTIELQSADDTVYLRGNNPGGFAVYGNRGFNTCTFFEFTGSVNAGGDVQTIVDSTGESKTGVMMPLLFAGDPRFLTREGDPVYSDVLKTAPSLGAESVPERGYMGMFARCSGLTAAPALPATTLAAECYMGMFDGCTSLTVAPALPATTLATKCYTSMFRGCTSLVTAPALAATTLATGCYTGMFADCTSLAAAMVLPATALAEGCYSQMFAGCTSLGGSPDLPASALAGDCYGDMFTDCGFDMSDDGQTFNFECGVQFPYNDGNLAFETPKDMAGWMGNTEGFDSMLLYMPYVWFEDEAVGGGKFTPGGIEVFDAPAAVFYGGSEGGYFVTTVVLTKYGDDEFSVKLSNGSGEIECTTVPGMYEPVHIAYDYADVMREKVASIAGDTDLGFIDEYLTHYEGWYMHVVEASTQDNPGEGDGTVDVYVNGGDEPYVSVPYSGVMGKEEVMTHVTHYGFTYGNVSPVIMETLNMIMPGGAVGFTSVEKEETFSYVTACFFSDTEYNEGNFTAKVNGVSAVCHVSGGQVSDILDMADEIPFGGFDGVSDSRYFGYFRDFLLAHADGYLYMCDTEPETVLPEDGTIEVLYDEGTVFETQFAWLGEFNDEMAMVSSEAYRHSGLVKSEYMLTSLDGEDYECLTASPLLRASGDGYLFTGEFFADYPEMTVGSFGAPIDKFKRGNFYTITEEYVRAIPKGLCDEMDAYRNFAYDNIGKYRCPVGMEFASGEVPEYLMAGIGKNDLTVLVGIEVPDVTPESGVIIERDDTPDYLRLTAVSERDDDGCEVYITTILRGDEYPDIEVKYDGHDWTDAFDPVLTPQETPEYDLYGAPVWLHPDTNAKLYRQALPLSERDNPMITYRGNTCEVYEWGTGAGQGGDPVDGALFGTWDSVNQEYANVGSITTQAVSNVQYKRDEECGDGWVWIHPDTQEEIHLCDLDRDGNGNPIVEIEGTGYSVYDKYEGLYGTWDENNQEYVHVGALDPATSAKYVLHYPVIRLAQGQSVLLRGENPKGTGSAVELMSGKGFALKENMTGITLWGTFDVSGRLSSLVDPSGRAVRTPGAAFAGLFSNFMFLMEDDMLGMKYLNPALKAKFEEALAETDDPESLLTQVRDASGLILPECDAAGAFLGMFMMQFGMETVKPDVMGGLPKVDYVWMFMKSEIGAGWREMCEALGLPADTPFPDNMLELAELFYEHGLGAYLGEITMQYMYAYGVDLSAAADFEEFEEIYSGIDFGADMYALTGTYSGMNFMGGDIFSGDIEMSADGRHLSFGGIVLPIESNMMGEHMTIYKDWQFSAATSGSVAGFDRALSVVTAADAGGGYATLPVALEDCGGYSLMGGEIQENTSFTDDDRVCMNYVDGDNPRCEFMMFDPENHESLAMNLTAAPAADTGGSLAGFVRWETTSDGGETWTVTGNGRSLQGTLGGLDTPTRYRAVYSSDTPVYVAFHSVNGGSISASSSGDTLAFETSSTPDFANPAQTDLSETVQIAAGGTLYVRAAQQQGGIRFSMTGDISVSGTMVALYGSAVCDNSNKYAGLFEGCTALTGAGNLSLWFDPGSESYVYVFHKMFYGCTSLTSAPSLPSVIPDDYGNNMFESMFEGCTSLTTAPALPSNSRLEGEDCFKNMFKGCTSLTSVQSELPATSVSNSAYEGMFEGCTSLEEAPAIMVKKHRYDTSSFDGMFAGCTSLTEAAAMPNLAWGGVLTLSEYKEIVYFLSGSSPRILFDGMYAGSGVSHFRLFENVTGVKVWNTVFPVDGVCLGDMVSGIADQDSVAVVEVRVIGPESLSGSSPQPSTTELVYGSSRTVEFSGDVSGLLKMTTSGDDYIVEPAGNSLSVVAGNAYSVIALDNRNCGYLAIFNSLDNVGDEGCIFPVDAGELRTFKVTGFSASEQWGGGYMLNEECVTPYTSGEAIVSQMVGYLNNMNCKSAVIEDKLDVIVSSGGAFSQAVDLIDGNGNLVYIDTDEALTDNPNAVIVARVDTPANSLCQ